MIGGILFKIHGFKSRASNERPYCVNTSTGYSKRELTDGERLWPELVSLKKRLIFPGFLFG